MCFSPKISLATALIEFGAGIFIFLKSKKPAIAKLLAIFIILLGLYQFTQFMLCETTNPNLWGTIAFTIYTFLPPLGIHFILKYANKKINKLVYLVYLPAIIFSFIAIFTKDFIILGKCSTIFVILNNHFTQLDTHFIPTVLYCFYYLTYIISICIILLFDIKSEKNKIRKKIYIIILMADLLSLLPALLLITILPSLSVMFPSIYCQFALICAILALIAVYLDNKYLEQ